MGHLELGEASVAVAVSAPHRGEAFEAARWLIDTLKDVVPIWKKENWSDGTSEWIHPVRKGEERRASRVRKIFCEPETAENSVPVALAPGSEHAIPASFVLPAAASSVAGMAEETIRTCAYPPV